MKLLILTAAAFGIALVSASGAAHAQATCTTHQDYGLACGDNAVSPGFGATAIGAETSATGVYSTAVGFDAQANGNTATAFGALSEAGAGSVALGAAARATGASSVAIGTSSRAEEDYTVSFGSSTIKRRLVNLADGTAATDAATVGQMDSRIAAASAAASAYADLGDARTLAAAQTYADQGDAQTLDAARAYTDSQIAALGGGSKQMQEYANSGTAAAIAAASIPQAFAPGGSMLGAGLGHWRGETALSVGGSYMLPSGRVVLRGSASVANRGGSGGGVGVGVAF